VLVCSERKVLLAVGWWLVCSERKVLVADKPSEQGATHALITYSMKTKGLHLSNIIDRIKIIVNPRTSPTKMAPRKLSSKGVSQQYIWDNRKQKCSDA
jgi:hypothetical protein